MIYAHQNIHGHQQVDGGGGVTYDLIGRRIELDDPDLGLSTYKHSVFGEVVEQIVPFRLACRKLLTHFPNSGSSLYPAIGMVFAALNIQCNTGML